MPLVVILALLESPQQVRFNESDLEIFTPKVQEILKFEYLCH
jgi:hypothetical protein